jgi:hypothetical protein
MNPVEERIWEVIKITPEKWQQRPYGDAGGGFWAVGLIGRLRSVRGNSKLFAIRSFTNGYKKKGVRKINVDGHEFRWRATGNDGWITLVLWPSENEESKLIGQLGYHSRMVPKGDGCYSAINQIVITNRLVREILLHVGVPTVLKNKGQINIGEIEKICALGNAIRGKYGAGNQ